MATVRIVCDDSAPIRRRETAEVAGYAREATMDLQAPPMWMFIVSLVIAVIAIVGVFTPIPYVTEYGFWVAILAYIVLVVGNLAKT